MRASFSKILMTSVLGVLVFSVSHVSAQNLLINPYPNGKKEAAKPAPSAVKAKVKWISNADTGVSIGATPQRQSLAEYNPKILKPAAAGVDRIVRLPTRGSAPAKIPAAAPVKILKGEAPQTAVRTVKVSDSQTTRDLLNSVLDDGKGLVKSTAPAMSPVPSAVAVKAKAEPVVEKVAVVPVLAPTPVKVAPQVVAKAAPTPVTKFYSNAQELGFALENAGELPGLVIPAPVPAPVVAPSPVVMAKKVVAPVKAVKTKAKAQAQDVPLPLIQPQKVAQFKDTPIVGVSDNPVLAAHLARSRVVKARDGIVPVQEVNVPTPMIEKERTYIEPILRDVMPDVPEVKVAAKVSEEVKAVRRSNRRMVPSAVESVQPVSYGAPTPLIQPQEVAQFSERPIVGLIEDESILPMSHSASGGVAPVSREVKVDSLYDSMPGIQVIRRPTEIQNSYGDAPVYDTYRADVVREYSTQREWKALQGYELKDILYNWSARAGVRLIWDTPGQYATRRPLRVSTTYQNAVKMILDQYQDSANRPVGTMYTDPQTSERYLVIKTDS